MRDLELTPSLLVQLVGYYHESKLEKEMDRALLEQKTITLHQKEAQELAHAIQILAIGELKEIVKAIAREEITPSTDKAVSNAPEDKVGVASGIYKMASSLGGSFGIAISATVYGVLANTGNVNLAAMAGLLTNVGFCLVSLFAVVLTTPKEKKILKTVV